MVKLEKVTAKNIWDILKLRVSEEQNSFVAGNDKHYQCLYHHNGKRICLSVWDL